ncbi:MAG: hypothetical protein DRQ88_08815 [Epsilonproteobacteria bacterium]|nr:MAG: hypothetical protein DRQ89_08910 [Campylobacterota bacterium]RLA65683.1 MAG: hypothetical protein DRQ88_08815 [Campylobacterota bacterium]
MRGWKKGQLLIHPKFQIKFIVFLVAALFLAILFFYLGDLYFLKQLSVYGKELNLPPNHAFYKLLGMQKSIMNKVFLFTGVFVFIYLVIFGLILSNRVAGPLIKLRSYFEDMAETGKLKKISFREGDFFKEIEVAFNKSVEKLESKKDD